MDLQLEGRRAVVTGGSRGIAFAVGRALAAEGASVALVSGSASQVEEQAALLRAETGAEVIEVVADTGDDTSVTAMAAAVKDRLDGVDILVSNAAAMNPGAIPEDALKAEINVKVRGYLRCVRAFAPEMTDVKARNPRLAKRSAHDSQESACSHAPWMKTTGVRFTAGSSEHDDHPAPARGRRFSGSFRHRSGATVE
ncbi:SDR family NAD(P)-dependent oxidoreductase [Streptomyces sp. NPDC002513]